MNRASKILSYFCFSKMYKPLRIIYIVAFFFFVIVFIFGLEKGGDTRSYYSAKEVILSGKLNHLRTPLYPLFLILTKNWNITILIQWFIFFISIHFLYKTLKIIKISPKIIFITLLLYVCHPVFTFYQNQVIPEGLIISLSSFLIYFMVKYVTSQKKSYNILFHITMLCMIFLKPGCIFLLALSPILIFYFHFKENKIILLNILPFILTLFIISGYCFALKKTYNVFGISSVSDINLFWMLKDQKKINIDLIENENVKTTINKADKEYSFAFPIAIKVINKNGWYELHRVVQKPLKGNYIAFLLNEHNLTKIESNLHDSVGKSFDYFHFKEPYKKYSLSNYFLSFNFYVLILILTFYSYLIIKQFLKFKKKSILSILLFIWVTANFSSIILTSPNNYGRLIVPSVVAILLICIQCTQWSVSIIKKRREQYTLM